MGSSRRSQTGGGGLARVPNLRVCKHLSGRVAQQVRRSVNPKERRRVPQQSSSPSRNSLKKEPRKVRAPQEKENQPTCFAFKKGEWRLQTWDKCAFKHTEQAVEQFSLSRVAKRFVHARAQRGTTWEQFSKVVNMVEIQLRCHTSNSKVVQMLLREHRSCSQESLVLAQEYMYIYIYTKGI